MVHWIRVTEEKQDEISGRIAQEMALIRKCHLSITNQRSYAVNL
jgi:hypothetical protein